MKVVSQLNAPWQVVAIPADAGTLAPITPPVGVAASTVTTLQIPVVHGPLAAKLSG